MNKRRVTLADVAKRAGVSKVTVSNILNNRPTAVPISEATRERVLAVVQELGYYPNAVARALARQRTDTIAIVLQFPAIFQGWSGFTSELMHGVIDKAIELGYDILMETRAQPSVEAEAQALMDGRVDGALLLRDYNDPLSDILAQRGFPHVLFFTRSPRTDAYWVDCDNLQGARLATEHLIRLGHTRIAHLAGSMSALSARERLQGYRQTMEAHGLEVHPEWVISATYGGADLSPLQELLRRPDRPTALFAWSDEVAVRALRLCEAMGLRIPDDIAIVGYDSTPICDHTRPTLTSVRQPIYEMAAAAVALLVDLLNEQNPEPKTRLFAPSLQVRESCGGEHNDEARD
ncbi:MAG: LacI family DNA-binding transcriptional regulator [Fimbriimonadales bacterium]